MNSLCELIHHKHNIHEIRLHDNSRKAVDVMAAQMWALLESWNIDENGDELRLLINMSESGVPSVTYVMRKVREWFIEHRATLEHLHIREVYLAPTSSEMLLSLARSVAKVIPINAEMKFFGEDDYESAIAWLRKTDSDNPETSPATEDNTHER